MNQRNLRGVVLFTGILLVVFWVVVSSVNNIDAETNITPTLYVTDLSYLPYVRGLVAGPTATATLPFPTLTPTPTATNTPTPTATATTEPYPEPATNTPRPTATSTATNTPTPTATDTVPPVLTAPTLYDIENSDQDGNFTVVWSAVAGADFYQLMENHNDTGFVEIFKGPELSIDRSNMAPGEYCYNVRARGGSQWSEWPGEKCTTVVGEPEPEYVCEFETIYEGPRGGGDLELLHDGRVFITQTSEDSASIFDPNTRSFERVDLPQGGGRYAAVLSNGKVLLTVEGTDPHSMIYDPVVDEVTRLDSIIECLGVYSSSISPFITYCGDNHGYIYGDISRADWPPTEYWLDIERDGYSSNEAFIIFENEFRGWYTFQITNGIASTFIDYRDGELMGTSAYFDHWSEYGIDYGSASALSNDKNKIYISGGVPGSCGSGTGGGTTTVVSYVSTLDGGYGHAFERTADMGQARQGHTMIGTFDGTIISLGGDGGEYYCEGEDLLRDIEIYVPSSDKWYTAGSLNIARAYSQKVMQLLNGEIFVFGGRTEPGPGYGYAAPTEIGRCELKANN